MCLPDHAPRSASWHLGADRRRFLTVAGLALILCLPVATSIWMTHALIVDQLKGTAAERAASTIERAQRISEQLESAIDELKATRGSTPCSPTKLLRMRQLVLGLNLLSDVGYVHDNTLACSALGKEPIDIGPPSYRSDLGYEIRLDIPYSFAAGAQFIMSTDPSTGYSALVNKETIFSTPTPGPVAIADLIGVKTARNFSGAPLASPRWLALIRSASQGQVVVAGDILAWRKSAKYDYLAYAVIPAAAMTAQFRRALLFVIPGGVLLGAFLCWCTLALVRLQSSMRAWLRTALRRGEFYLLYQPIVDMRDGTWVGAEALLRWRRATGEIISPDLFIPIAEKLGLMNRLTATVLDRVERDVPLLCTNREDFFVSINFSAEDFSNPALIQQVGAMIERTGLAPRHFHIEATERIFLDPQATQAGVAALHGMGVEVAIDDFGTGFSGLAYLTNISMDSLKIDKCFVQTAGTGSVTTNVVAHIIDLAMSLNMKMIAEGVETIEQAHYLQERGVQMAQGWLYGKPITAQEFARRLREAPQPEPAAQETGG